MTCSPPPKPLAATGWPDDTGFNEAVMVLVFRRYCRTTRSTSATTQSTSQTITQSSQLQITTSQTSPSEAATRREQAVLFADALARLPDDHREVIALRHLEGLTFSAVAGRMGRTVDSVETLWLRALARLRQVVGEG